MGLVVAALLMTALLAWVLRQQRTGAAISAAA
jgi:hypothetical protein